MYIVMFDLKGCLVLVVGGGIIVICRIKGFL